MRIRVNQEEIFIARIIVLLFSIWLLLTFTRVVKNLASFQNYQILVLFEEQWWNSVDLERMYQWILSSFWRIKLQYWPPERSDRGGHYCTLIALTLLFTLKLTKFWHVFINFWVIEKFCWIEKLHDQSWFVDPTRFLLHSYASICVNRCQTTACVAYYSYYNPCMSCISLKISSVIRILGIWNIYEGRSPLKCLQFM